MKKLILVLLSITLLNGCYEKSLPDNVIATVNGKYITLHTVQSLQEMEFTDFNYQGKPSLTKLREQYGATLSTIILYEIVLQYLESKGSAISDAQVEEYEKIILAGYPAGEFENYITENAINIDAWRALLRYQLALSVFKDTFLRNAYVPSVEEVEKYYTEHHKSFMLPASFTLQIGLSEDNKSLENIDNLQELLDKKSELEQYGITLKASDIPKQKQKAIIGLKEQDCTDIILENEEFSVICLVSKNKAESLSITKAYAYIESELIEQRLGELLHTWLEQNAQGFEVKVSEHLIKEII